MPLLSTLQADKDVVVALWRITETIEEFRSSLSWLSFPEGEFSLHRPCDARLLEKYATHALSLFVTGSQETISHLPSGKPVISRGHISVSHTKGYAAIAYSPSREVAIDIEYISDRVNRIAHKFLREDEPLTDTFPRLVAWCAKETAYKYFSSDDLSFTDMRIRPFALRDGGCKVDNLKRDESLPVTFRLTDDFVLAYGFK